MEEASRFLASARFRWWVTGGQALELYAETSWRPHVDLDIGFLRSDATDLWTFLHDWERYVFAAGALSPWDGAPLDQERQQHNVWCRRSSTAPWFLDFTANNGDDTGWADHADQADRTARVSWEAAVLTTETGIPFLAPDLTLLAKSRDHRHKDDLDAAMVIPKMDASRRRRLADMLPSHHAWQGLLR